MNKQQIKSIIGIIIILAALAQPVFGKGAGRAKAGPVKSSAKPAAPAKQHAGVDRAAFMQRMAAGRAKAKLAKEKTPPLESTLIIGD